MENFLLKKKSQSGFTVLTDKVYFEVNTPKTYASSILLKRYYWEHDVDNKHSKAYRMRKIAFSRNYLTNLEKTTGPLSCTYCNKQNLIIELEGMRVKKNVMATIDHIDAISNGGAVFDVKNVTCACGKCNNDKGSSELVDWIMGKIIKKLG
jgi:5-methylcytosine-specific restriction endonuclease McrA